MRTRAARSLIAACSVAAAAGSAPSTPAEAQPALDRPGWVDDDPQRPLSPINGQAEQLWNNILRDQRTLQEQLSTVDARARQAHLRTIARGRAYVRLTRAGLLPAGAGIESLIEHASRVERLKRAIDRDLKLERELLELKARMLKKSSELEARLSAMQAERELMNQNRVALEAARDRALAFEQAFSTSASNHTAIYGAGVGPATLPTTSSGFGALKGRLPFPLTGRTEVRAARRRSASGPALEMLAPEGSAVRAVYPGTVAFADEYADYGKSIILDHGDGYFTVSANLGVIDVKVGDDVGSGSRVATLGSSASLYFEIRSGTDTLDPAEWFGI